MNGVDYSNGSDLVAEIIFEQEPDEYYRFDPQNEDRISDFLYDKIGEECRFDGVPWFMEAASWCTFACDGDALEADDLFTIEIIEL